MKLSKLLEGIDAECNNFEDADIKSLTHNSKEVENGGLFFAIEGTKVNGCEFILDAIASGASAVVSSKDLNISGVTTIKVDDVREAMSKMSANFYGHPDKDMLIFGVTGTNGKTTSTYMLASVLKEAGHKVGVIGTNGVFLNGVKLDSNLTTPDPIYLLKTLAFFKEKGATAVCMEVSAHALELQKTRGIMTDIALFTNLTQDHLDFFSNMDNYGEAKAKLFSKDMSKMAVFNLDDDFGKELFLRTDLPALTYSRERVNPNFNDANIIASNEAHNTSSQTFTVKTPVGEEEIELSLLGGFNVSNALGVIGAGILAGIDLETIKRGLKSLQKVDGRFNSYDVNGIRVVIDYAHTPDGLCNILKSAREITDGRVISVFGCGGNRDRAKRSIMGKISSDLADYTIVTTDNPRYERPEDIARDVALGLTEKPYSVELDRKKAIRLAISMAKEGDTIVLAGKGAEPYIDMLGVKTPYEDRRVVEEIMSELKK